MYRDHILAWVLGVFDRIKGGARRNMESEKFTEIFEEELGLTKAFLDADIGGRFAESFVISIRTNVSTGDPPEQKLAHVGTINTFSKSTVQFPIRFRVSPCCPVLARSSSRHLVYKTPRKLTLPGISLAWWCMMRLPAARVSS